MEKVKLPPRYRPGVLLGRGGMGSVWQAHDLELNRPVAVKVLDPSLAGDSQQRERFLREARLASSLEHPAVLRILDVGEDEGSPYIVMELVRGGSLRDRMKAGLSLPDALPFMVEVAEALAAAEARGIMHRDLKPGNVLLDEEGRVRVADWGLAKSMADTEGLTKTGVMMGTPTYMAPEQVRGIAVGCEVDRYAFGAMLFELATGRPPFQGRNLGEILSKHLAEEAPSVRSFRPKLPEAFDELVAACLAKEPSRRPPAAELAHRLRELIPCLAVLSLPDSGESTLPANSSFSAKETRPPSASSGKGGARAPSSRAAVPPMGASPAPSGRGPGRGAFLAGAAVFLLVLAAFFARSSKPSARREGEAKAVPPSGPFLLEEILHPEARRLELRYSGVPEGAWKLEVLEAKGGRVLPLTGMRAFDFTSSRAVSRRVRALTLHVPWTFHRRRWLRVRSLEGSRSQEGSLPPWEGAEALLSSIDRMAASGFDELLVQVDRLRGDLVRVYEGVKTLDPSERRRRRSEASKRSIEGLRRLLKTRGIDEETFRRLGELLPSMLHEGCLPHDPIARRVLPLRYVEASLSDHDRSPPPWGNVSGHLGVEFIPSDRITALGGWIELGRRRLLHSLDEEKKIHRWTWITSPAFHEVLGVDSQAMMQFQMQLPEIFSNKNIGRDVTEKLPDRVEQVSSNLLVEIDVQDPGDRPWPPDRFAVDLIVRLFERTCVLCISVNDSPVARVLQTSFFSPPPHLSSLRAWRIAVPFHPKWAKKGKNSLKVTVESLPGLRVIHLMSVREAALRASWREGDESPARDGDDQP